jgi:hypothetical protein
LAVSNPKFEYWLLLHFEDGTRIGNSRQCTEYLKRYLPHFEKGHVEVNKLRPGVHDATRRAKLKDTPPCVDWPSRIKKLENGMVTFTFKNRKKKTTETVTITAVEFIRRFLLHSLPKGFVRIRHYGFMANRYRNENLNTIRQLIGVSTPNEKDAATLEEMMLQLTGTDITLCTCCTKGKMHFFAEIPKGRAGPQTQLACLMC